MTFLNLLTMSPSNTIPASVAFQDVNPPLERVLNRTDWSPSMDKATDWTALPQRILPGLLAGTANPQMLAIFRVCASVVGVGFFASYYNHLPFTWFARSPHDQYIAHCVCVAMIAVLVARGIGWGGPIVGRALSLVHFFGSSWLLTQTFPYTTVNEELYLMTAFWTCFVPLESRWSLSKPRKAPVPSWPLILLGANAGIYFFTAGLDKLHDPIWQRGTGFYHFYLLPWVQPTWLRPALDYEVLMVVLNYVTIVVELSILPLVMFRRSRLLACGLLAAFFWGLIFPFRIDWIGPVGLLVPLAISASTPFADRLFAKEQRVTNDALPRRLECWVALFLVVYATVMSTRAVVSVPGRSPIPERLRRRVDKVINAICPQFVILANARSTFFSYKGLFSSPHTVGVWAFRVEVESADGSVVEPIQVFKQDLSGGHYTHGLGMPRYYQGCMYPIGYLAMLLAKGASVTDAECIVPDHILRYAARNPGQKARILVCPIAVPRDYRGDIKLWLDYPWVSIRSYDVDSGVFRLEDRPIAPSE